MLRSRVRLKIRRQSGERLKTLGTSFAHLLRRFEQLILGSEPPLRLGGDQHRLLRGRLPGLTRCLEIHACRRDNLSCGIVDRQAHVQFILFLFNEGAVGSNGREFVFVALLVDGPQRQLLSRM